jgi:2-oxoglutarate ferredoxin oxidoreductase subunit gamma
MISGLNKGNLMEFDVVCAGFGGQGIMVMGNLLAYAAMDEGRNVTFFPSYGPEMRGGTANCTVVISNGEIGSPIVGHPRCTIIMNHPSLTKFELLMRPKGLLMLNRSLVDPGLIQRQDLKVISVPLLDLARMVGNDRLANMVMLGAFAQTTGIVKLSTVESVMEHAFAAHYHRLIPKNIEALRKGAGFIEAQGESNFLPLEDTDASEH